MARFGGRRRQPCQPRQLHLPSPPQTATAPQTQRFFVRSPQPETQTVLLFPHLMLFANKIMVLEKQLVLPPHPHKTLGFSHVIHVACFPENWSFFLFYSLLKLNLFYLKLFSFLFLCGILSLGLPLPLLGFLLGILLVNFVSKQNHEQQQF